MAKKKITQKRRHRLETGDESARLHLKLGWWTICFFVTMGIVLETLHGFKIGWYLNVGNEARRQLLMAAHGFGVVYGVLHIGFALTSKLAPHWDARQRVFASSCITSAGLFIPGGLILAGVYQRNGLPGMGIVLVVIGLLLTLLAIGYVAVGSRRVLEP